MAIGDVIKLVNNSVLYSENVQNVLYYKVLADDGSDDNEVALANEFFSEVLSAWVGAVVEAVEFTCIQTQKVFPLPVGSTFDRFVTAAGTQVGQGLPATDAGLIRKFNPAVGGVGRKGRVYLAGMPEAQVNLGRITGIQKTTMESVGLELIQTIISATGGQYLPVWATRDATTPFAINGSVDWTNFTVMPRIATQRRRRTPIVAFSTP